MESKGRLILLVIAGIIVAFAAIAIRNHMSESDAPAVVDKAPVSNRVIVAKHDIAAGTLVQGLQDLDWANIDESEMKENYLRENMAKPEDFMGAVARRTMHAGDVVTLGTLSKAGEGGFMSAVLEPGMRAVSVAVTATSGNAGFISPGDKVDLIVTHRIKSKDNSGQDSVISETFVRNVRVLAVDQMLDNPENKAVLAKTVTVEVNPHQAEQVAVANEMGKISMALRSLGAMPTAQPATGTPNGINDLYGEFTRDSDVSQALSHGAAVTPHIRVIRGDQIENLELN